MCILWLFLFLVDNGQAATILPRSTTDNIKSSVSGGSTSRVVSNAGVPDTTFDLEAFTKNEAVKLNTQNIASLNHALAKNLISHQMLPSTFPGLMQPIRFFEPPPPPFPPPRRQELFASPFPSNVPLPPSSSPFAPSLVRSGMPQQIWPSPRIDTDSPPRLHPVERAVRWWRGVSSSE